MPLITIETGMVAPDGREERITEFICDYPGCPNVASQVLGCVVDLGQVSAVCDEHAPKPKI